jgi:phage shock protein PspC (stress-responsive transcriptional regulator)
MNVWESLKKLTKSSKDKYLGGVCGGLGMVTPVPAWMWRVAFLFCFVVFGIGGLLYVILWICLPNEPAPSNNPPILGHQ